MNRSESIKEFAVAFAKAQGMMEAAKKSAANPYFKSKYADLAEVVASIKQALESNGLSYLQSFSTAYHADEEDRTWWVNVSTLILHSSGEWIESTVPMPLTKLDPQSMGSVTTYGRRYGLQTAMGLPADDDDAESAMPRNGNGHTPTLPKAQLDKQRKRLNEAASMDDLRAIWEEFSKDERKIMVDDLANNKARLEGLA
jgi:hypothetical protein